MSLFDAAERFAAMDRSQVILDPKRCLHSLDQNSTCSACLGLCPENAILEGKPPSTERGGLPFLPGVHPCLPGGGVPGG